MPQVARGAVALDAGARRRPRSSAAGGAPSPCPTGRLGRLGHGLIDDQLARPCPTPSPSSRSRSGRARRGPARSGRRRSSSTSRRPSPGSSRVRACACPRAGRAARATRCGRSGSRGSSRSSRRDTCSTRPRVRARHGLAARWLYSGSPRVEHVHDLRHGCSLRPSTLLTRITRRSPSRRTLLEPGPALGLQGRVGLGRTSRGSAARDLDRVLHLSVELAVPHHVETACGSRCSACRARGARRAASSPGSFRRRTPVERSSVVPGMSGPPGAPGGSCESPRKCNPIDASP